LTDLATIGRDKTRVVRTIVVIFILALITIAAAIYSDVVLRSGPISGTATPDSTAVSAIAGTNRPDNVGKPDRF
jgi:hypothetical protein